MRKAPAEVSEGLASENLVAAVLDDDDPYAAVSAGHRRAPREGPQFVGSIY